MEWPRPTGEYYPRATLSIEEGREYDFGVDPRALGEGFTLPPGFAACGTLESDPNSEGNTDAEDLQAVGQIPQETTPTTLSIGDFESADLTEEPNRANCAPTEKYEPEEVTIRAPTSASATASGTAGATTGNASESSQATLRQADVFTLTNPTNQPPYAQTILFFDLENQNKLDDFYVGDLSIWLLDDDGVVRTPNPTVVASGERPEMCKYPYGYSANPLSITLGPSQQEHISVCFPYRKGHQAAAVLIKSPDAGIYSRLHRY